MESEDTPHAVGGEGEGEFPKILATPHEKEVQWHLHVLPVVQWVELHLMSGRGQTILYYQCTLLRTVCIICVQHSYRWQLIDGCGFGCGLLLPLFDLQGNPGETEWQQ